MKKRKTNFVKLGMLLFGVSILLWNCFPEEINYIEQKNNIAGSKYKLERITYKDLLEDIEFKGSLNLIEKISLNNKLQNNNLNRTTEQLAEGLTVITDSIHKVIYDDVITWTFEIETPAFENSDFENFLVKKYNDEYTYYLISYELNEVVSETLYKKVITYGVSEEHLILDNLDLASRNDDAFDWVIDNGGGDDDCVGILYEMYAQCDNGGNADGHSSVCINPPSCSQYCSGSPFIGLGISYAHCNSGGYDVPDGPGPDNTSDNPNDSQIGSGGGPNDSDGDNTATSPVNVVDPRCPPLASGKIFVNGVCICPWGYKEDPATGYCIEDDCNTSKDDLKKIFPNASDAILSTFATVINEKGKDFGINTKEELQHFLAQVGHETGGLGTLNVTENLNYSTASRLAGNYRRFTLDSTLAANNNDRYYAPNYLQNSSGVANVAMCCSYENGNVASGDGWRYRGRGILQLTWKENYRRFKEWYNNKYDPDKDFVANPDLISNNDTLAIVSGLWYFQKRVLNRIQVDSMTTVEKITPFINSESKGLIDRKEKYTKAKDSIKCIN